MLTGHWEKMRKRERLQLHNFEKAVRENMYDYVGACIRRVGCTEVYKIRIKAARE